MMPYKYFAVLFIFALTFSAPFAAKANEARLLGTYGDWAAYTFKEDGNKVCYMASQPIKEQGDYTKRGEIFALITHRPAEDTENVFSYMAGYPYKTGSNVTVKVNGNTYRLFTYEETAWAPDAKTDNELADSIRRGSRMVVKGTSSRGTLTTDTFSLKGSSKAHDAISRECGV